MLEMCALCFVAVIALGAGAALLATQAYSMRPKGN
jgi:uncharacterized protein involved in exopolysaccharide biosynthesis